MRLRRMAHVALVLVAGLAVALAAVFAVLATEALGPASYAVSGTVTMPGPLGTVPVAGATVLLSVNGGPSVATQTDGAGGFSFSGVSPGGISINISKPDYAPVTVLTFASPVYGTSTTGLSVTLVRGTVSNGTTESLSPFPDLETFVAAIGSAVVVLGIVALLGGWAAVVTRRSDRPAVGVVGGAGGLLAPVALYLLALGNVFPPLLIGTSALAAAGAFALTTRCLELYQVGPDERTS